MSFFFAPQNMPFAVALLVMLFIAVLEGALVVIGAGLSQFIDSLLPDIDIDADVDAPNGVSRLLAWLRVGEVPVLILLVIFLTVFGLTGLTVQYLLSSTTGWLLPSLVAAVPAMIAALPGTRFAGGLLGKVLLKDETEAIGTTDFIGQVVTITLGSSKQGSAAEARFRDRFGTTHYLMVEPDSDEVFAQGEQMLLVRRQGSVFFGIRAGNAHLTN